MVRYCSGALDCITLKWFVCLLLSKSQMLASKVVFKFKMLNMSTKFQYKIVSLRASHQMLCDVRSQPKLLSMLWIFLMEEFREGIFRCAPLCWKDRKPFLYKSIVIERSFAVLDAAMPPLNQGVGFWKDLRQKAVILVKSGWLHPAVIWCLTGHLTEDCLPSKWMDFMVAPEAHFKNIMMLLYCLAELFIITLPQDKWQSVCQGKLGLQGKKEKESYK